ncbi:ScbA/BarX family gamma-butyrolactone biosynthesis protein [Streptomyces sp. NBC_00847]|uniref:ScbA/BarX family gamma-butyrolactone biosynthesis protein n=1 Tax=unclassified Streptomyces TaxID=2593676 RepID=UPI00225199C7|nr:ScbA/BarX family gamma-butyrolactone biosynthesis protein [Streptomyces sp. NBC_00847]MCX4883158.1 ScbA/BarX family gamma-butyrolactone biosynthesis protein [Streptomyces sp. NBC_00847]
MLTDTLTTPPQSPRITTPAPGPRLSFTRPLPPAKVHKAAAGEVLLTDAVRHNDHRFTVAALWPRDRFLHHAGRDAPGDPMLLVETIRQALIHLSHTYYGIPPGHPFLLSTLYFDTDRQGLPAWRGAPLPVTVDVTCTPTTTAPRRFGMALDAVMYVDGLALGRAGMRWEVLDPQLYHLIRIRTTRSPADLATDAAPRDPRPLAPREVGYAHEEHVLLAEGQERTGRDWWLHMNRDHPVLFDHESDHIPGMLLLEALRQAAHAAELPFRPSLDAATASYGAFGELDAPVRISARLPGQGQRKAGAAVVEVTAVQGSAVLTSARFGEASCPPGNGEEPS